MLTLWLVFHPRHTIPLPSKRVPRPPWHLEKSAQSFPPVYWATGFSFYLQNCSEGRRSGPTTTLALMISVLTVDVLVLDFRLLTKTFVRTWLYLPYGRAIPFYVYNVLLGLISILLYVERLFKFPDKTIFYWMVWIRVFHYFFVRLSRLEKTFYCFWRFVYPYGSHYVFDNGCRIGSRNVKNSKKFCLIWMIVQFNYLCQWKTTYVNEKVIKNYI